MSSATLFRFQLEVSDVDRNFYEPLDLRTALHPSETHICLVTRVIAYVLNAQEDLNFSPGGLSDPDAPAIRLDDIASGSTKLWIEVGSPNARKLHKASKAADQVKVYTYKDPEILLKEIRSNDIHHADSLIVHSFDPKYLELLASNLEKNNKWAVLISDGSLFITLSNGNTEQTEIRSHQI
ncbi:YaeQ family protein [bacterium]|nr:YaeQ family protein [bacterium]